MELRCGGAERSRAGADRGARWDAQGAAKPRACPVSSGWDDLMLRQVVPSVNPSRELPVQPPSKKISHRHLWPRIAARSRAGAAASAYLTGH